MARSLLLTSVNNVVTMNSVFVGTFCVVLWTFFIYEGAKGLENISQVAT